MSMTNSVRNPHRDVIVCGAGPVGLAAALALADTGAAVAICGELPEDAPANPDLRTAALFAPQIEILAGLGIWPGLEASCAPMRGIRLVDDMGHVLRAPETLFMARDADLPELGHNCPNPALVGALAGALRDRPEIDCRFGARVISVEHDPDHEAATPVVRFTVPGRAKVEELRAPLIVAADGRNSLARTAAGIGTRTWDTRQSALTAHIHHSEPHHGISTEFHRPGGPVTVVPMPGDRSALIWVDRPGAIRQLVAQESARAIHLVADELHGLLGEIREISPLRSFPLTGRVARRLAGRRTAVIGEAAHVFPPIGAQGLNLSLRDVATLAETVGEARSGGEDIGSDAVLEAYARRRLVDTHLRAHGVDLLGATLTSAWPAPALVRGATLHAVNASPALKRAMILQALGPRLQAPRAGLTQPHTSLQ